MRYLKDNYQREFKSKVIEADDKFIIFDDSIFYPNSGGQPNDTGLVMKGDENFKVIYVGKFSGKISHEVDRPGLKAGDDVIQKIDWDRRYMLMIYHTAAHIISQIIEKETGAKITGNQLSLQKGRIDFNLEEFDKEKLNDYINQANEIIQKELPVNKYFMDREEALKKPELFSLKNVLPPNVEELRIVEIEGFDITACGGTHVDNTKEIGSLEFLKAENKGKNNRRLYFKIA